MTLFQLYLERLKASLLVVLASICAGVVAWRAGANEEFLYPGIFVFAATAMLLALLDEAKSHRKGHVAEIAAEPSFQKVLIVEQERLLEEQLRELLRPYGVQVEGVHPAREIWSAHDLGIGAYDVVIADAQLPYFMLADLKSTLRQQVWVVLSLPRQLPSGLGSTTKLRILETSGPERLRREVEQVLGEVAA